MFSVLPRRFYHGKHIHGDGSRGKNRAYDDSRYEKSLPPRGYGDGRQIADRAPRKRKQLILHAIARGTCERRVVFHDGKGQISPGSVYAARSARYCAVVAHEIRHLRHGRHDTALGIEVVCVVHHVRRN